MPRIYAILLAAVIVLAVPQMARPAMVEVRGVVLDYNDARVPFCEIRLQGTKGRSYKFKPDSLGRYAFRVKEGEYDVTVYDRISFYTVARTRIKVDGSHSYYSLILRPVWVNLYFSEAEKTPKSMDLACAASEGYAGRVVYAGGQQKPGEFSDEWSQLSLAAGAMGLYGRRMACDLKSCVCEMEGPLIFDYGFKTFHAKSGSVDFHKGTATVDGKEYPIREADQSIDNLPLTAARPEPISPNAEKGRSLTATRSPLYAVAARAAR